MSKLTIKIAVIVLATVLSAAGYAVAKGGGGMVEAMAVVMVMGVAGIMPAATAMVAGISAAGISAAGAISAAGR